MTYAERAYYSRHKKKIESTEDYLNHVTKAYNEIYSLINKVNDSKGCIQASNEINAFAEIVGKNATDVLKLRKQLINRIETVLEDNDTKIQDLKQEIKDIQSFDVSDTMEEATKLDRLATNRMYELMVSFNGNSNSTKRKLGNIILNKNGLDRISATALSRLCAIPAYADFFKPSYKETLNNQLSMTGTEVDVILEGINKYLLLLAKKQIEIAFEQAEKEVQDLQQRTKEGIETARRAGKQIGQRKGAVFTVKKAVYAKRKILEHNKTFGGSLTDKETQELAGISRNSLYLYKRELKEEYEQLESIDALKNKYDKFISVMEKKNQK